MSPVEQADALVKGSAYVAPGRALVWIGNEAFVVPESLLRLLAALVAAARKAPE